MILDAFSHVTTSKMTARNQKKTKGSSKNQKSPQREKEQEDIHLEGILLGLI